MISRTGPHHAKLHDPMNEGDRASEAPTRPRRSFLGWLTRGSVAVVGATAVLTGRSSTAFATCTPVGCCHLAFTDCAHTCSLADNGSVICPSGFFAKAWFCCSGGQT